MVGVDQEAKHFISRRMQEVAEARQCAAFYLTSGIDLATALAQEGEERKATLLRLGRLLERERLKGVRQHWSYDLNRHIALKQVFDRLSGKNDDRAGGRRRAQVKAAAVALTL